MPFITLGSNLSSISAQRRLAQNTASVRQSFERLSSGLRINHASDDSASLAVASDLNVNRRIALQGIRNFNDGIGLLNVAEGATGELTNIVTRLKELAEQAANGIYGVKQRDAIDKEAQALAQEYSRVARSTSFNGQALFSGSFGQLRIQGGAGLQGGILTSLGGATGSGNFASEIRTSASGVNFADVALSDLNGDGSLDMVAVGADSAEQVYIRLGQGDGNFGAASVITLGAQNLWDVKIGDVNNDGIMDLAAQSSASRTYLMLGNGDGTFRAPTSIGAPSFSEQVSLIDLNGDGNLDLTSIGTGLFFTRFGRGDGTFGTQRFYVHGISIIDTSSAFGDLNNDGITDMAIGGNAGAGGGSVSILLGNADGSFNDDDTFLANSSVPYEMQFADFNNDGKLDLVTAGG